MKVIAMIGVPGSGKTTVMKALMEQCKIPTTIQVMCKLVPYHHRDNIYILGKYEEGEVFGGTDKMSMAVQPRAIEFLDSLPDDSIVIFEGDRLGTQSFLEYADEHHDLSIIRLTTPRDIQKERFKERGSSQNETWLAGRESKVENISSNMFLRQKMVMVENKDPKDIKSIVDLIIKIMVDFNTQKV